MPAKPTTTIAPEQRRTAARSAGLDDEALLAECEQEVFIASGPGGQHRNKTETAVRLRHGLREKLAKRATAPKPRKKTRPTAASQRRRVEGKRRLSAKKRERRELGEQ